MKRLDFAKLMWRHRPPHAVPLHHLRTERAREHDHRGRPAQHRTLDGSPRPRAGPPRTAGGDGFVRPGPVEVGHHRHPPQRSDPDREHGVQREVDIDDLGWRRFTCTRACDRAQPRHEGRPCVLDDDRPRGDALRRQRVDELAEVTSRPTALGVGTAETDVHHARIRRGAGCVVVGHDCAAA